MNSIYAKVGESFQQIGGDCPDGFIIMTTERPGAEYVADAEGTWIKQTLTQESELVDPTVLAFAEALAAQETRLAKLEGGVSK